VILPEPGALADDLALSDVEVLIRPLCVLRRELLSPRGLSGIGGALARDAAGLTRLIRRRGIGLVHSNTSVVLGGAAGAALARVPHVWHVREIYARFGASWPAYRRVLLSARALPCVSSATAAQFGGSPRAVVIPDGLAIDARRAPRAQARAALGLDAEAPVVAVLGRISDWKGQDVLVRALAEPALREAGAIGLLAGAPWPGAEDRLRQVTDLAQRLGVADRVRLIGFRDDVENVYGAADVVAVPSTQPDPLPGAAIEAAAAGCAVVASAHGGLPEILRDGETGRLVAPGDAAALARVCAELLGDERERERLGSAAALDVRRRFASARQIQKIEALYAAVLGSPPSP
jgi:glycosyltransferase involved in cell wall biosynthesis